MEEVYLVSPFIESDSEELVFELKVTDSDGNFDTDDVTITVTKQNHPPKANAGPDRRIFSDSQVTITGIGVDPDGDEITYSWKQISGDAVSFNGTHASITFTSPSVVNDKQVVLTCSVSDGTFTVSDSLTVTIQNTLSLPIIANAGPDQIVNEKVKVNLDGSNSFDPENQTLSYMWTQTSGESVIINSASSEKVSFMSPTVANNEIKVLVFELRVYDDNGREAFDTVVITVDPVNAPPTAEASAIQE